MGFTATAHVWLLSLCMKRLWVGSLLRTKTASLGRLDARTVGVFFLFFNGNNNESIMCQYSAGIEVGPELEEMQFCSSQLLCNAGSLNRLLNCVLDGWRIGRIRV